MIKKALNQTRLISIAVFLLMLYTSSAIAMMGGSSTSHQKMAEDFFQE